MVAEKMEEREKNEDKKLNVETPYVYSEFLLKDLLSFMHLFSAINKQKAFITRSRKEPSRCNRQPSRLLDYRFGKNIVLITTKIVV